MAIFRTWIVPQNTFTGSEVVEVEDEDVVEKGPSVMEISNPPSRIFNPIGRYVAKYFSEGNGGREIF